ncbi:SDR family NAD(P)-dependent oxidoreductase, partial [Amycolatopsis ultiminotia]|uniref:type I polyketide synthase n=1 Tax=Amycolatopsis ultiminotia TaxID=543629 RepID=UPI003CD0AD64
FAVMVGLAAVWLSVGVEPDVVVGHSQGEIAAACVAGVLSLGDAARVVALRSQVIAAELSGCGGMASVALGEDEVVGRLERWGGRVEVAVVNGPSSVVIAGDVEALDEVVGVFEGEGVRVRRVAVDYASHSRQVAEVEGRLVDALAGVEARAPVVPFYSTVTGGWVEDAGVLDGGYWYRNLRSRVRFGPAVLDLLGQGYRVFVEVSAHPVLVQSVSEVVEGDVVVVGSLRRDDGGLRRLLTSMAELFVEGVPVEWGAVLPEAVGRVDLPTYAFDHQHYWLQPTESATDAVSLGLAGADHPMLGAVMQLPQSDGLVLTSRLSLRSHPWLADHAVRGVVIVPGTGLVELAVRAGDEAGCAVLDELVIEAPLVVPERGGVRVQVAVGAPGTNGSRTVDVYSQREETAGADAWTRHATGVLAPAGKPDRGGAEFDFTAWPPADAQPVDISGAYGVLAEVGYGYGPVFQAVRALWRRGSGADAEIFAEVAMPEEQRKEAGRFGIHPALLDAALHSTMVNAASAVGDGEADEQELRLPFAWNGLRLHAAGASVLRVRVAKPERDALSLEAVDEAGGLVVTMDSLVGRPVSNEQLATAAGPAHAGSLFRVDWTTQSGVDTGLPVPSWVPVETAEQVATLADDVLSGADAPALAVLDAVGVDSPLALTSRVLDVVQCWLAGVGLEGSLLVVVTRGAVGAGGGVVGDPAGAAVWGLVRAAQAENPGRIVLLDLDPAAAAAAGAESADADAESAGAAAGVGAESVDPGAAAGAEPVDPAASVGAEPVDPAASVGAESADPAVAAGAESAGAAAAGAEFVLGSVLAAGEPQVAVRAAGLSVPRLARAAPTDSPAVFSSRGTVLVTGGTGSLGALAARHLVERHGVRQLLLASRRGLAAEGAQELVADLTAQGAEVAVAACDVSDREQVAALVATVPEEHPLTGVVHTAGISDAGVIGTVVPEQLAEVFAPKVDAARHLDELTRGMDLDAFVVYSSVSSVFMGAGSGSYAAANAFLDGLMAQRRAAGLPGLSLAWGLWDQSTGMAAQTDEATRSRMNRRGGLVAMKPAEGMALFDAALGSEQALLVPAKLDLPGLRAGAAGGTEVPPLLRGLVRAGRQQAYTVGSAERAQLTDRLAGLTPDAQAKVLLDLVRAQVAAVLGYHGADRIDEDQGLFEIGFDSLTAIELRNRLRTVTERKIAPSVVFDHPTPRLLAAHLHELLQTATAAISV